MIGLTGWAICGILSMLTKQIGGILFLGRVPTVSYNAILEMAISLKRVATVFANIPHLFSQLVAQGIAYGSDPFAFPESERK